MCFIWLAPADFRLCSLYLDLCKSLNEIPRTLKLIVLFSSILSSTYRRPMVRTSSRSMSLWSIDRWFALICSFTHICVQINFAFRISERKKMYGRSYRFVHSELADSLRSAEEIYHSRKFENSSLIASATSIILFVALAKSVVGPLPLSGIVVSPIPHLSRVCSASARITGFSQYCIIRVNMFGTFKHD